MQNITKEVDVVSDGFSGSYDGINVTALNPPTTNQFKDINNDAIVLRIDDRNLSLLLTSDIQTGAQGRLISQRPTQIQTDVMEAPYYGVGAGTATSGVFLNTAKPTYVVITGSSDESATNGGSREPFERLLLEHNITSFMNYENGTIRIINQGGNYSIGPVYVAPPPDD